MPRLYATNLREYLQTNYGDTIRTSSKILSVTPLLQKELGTSTDGDCSITSMTAVAHYKKAYPGASVRQVYANIVEAAGKAYNGEKYGTIPVFIRTIMNKIFGTKTHVRYLKGIGFSWKDIVKQINANNPVLLSLTNDGRDYYTNHTVTIVGYIEYPHAKMLAVLDNWYKSVSYIDYKKLGTVCSINYV